MYIFSHHKTPVVLSYRNIVCGLFVDMGWDGMGFAVFPYFLPNGFDRPEKN
jgi:hypothetical protein